MIEYSYCIDASLEALNKNLISKEQWEKEGCPCIYVQYSTPIISEGDFVVHEMELKEFANKENIDVSNENSLISVFEKMLECENYVENVFL